MGEGTDDSLGKRAPTSIIASACPSRVVKLTVAGPKGASKAAVRKNVTSVSVAVTPLTSRSGLDTLTSVPSRFSPLAVNTLVSPGSTSG